MSKNISISKEQKEIMFDLVGSLTRSQIKKALIQSDYSDGRAEEAAQNLSAWWLENDSKN